MVRNFIFFFFCLLFGNAISQVYSFRDSASNGQALYKIKEYQSALSSYEQARELQKNVKMSAAEKAKLDIELGQAAFRLKDFEKASAYFQNACQQESDPIKRSALFRNMGNTAMQQKNIDQAIEYYKEGIKLNHKDAELKYNLSQALRQKHNEGNNEIPEEKRKNKGKTDNKTESELSQKNNSEKTKSPYSFEEEQKRKILNDLLRKEAETRRRIEKKQSNPSPNSKDW